MADNVSIFIFLMEIMQKERATLDELGRLVGNLCNIIPGGVICFFASYDYEKLVYAHWEKTGVIGRLAVKKKVLREPRRAGQVDQVLSEYTEAIQKCSSGITGSILFCVVGGKMSEGINFSDDLGRCVMMVGMPYPNINSPELKEKMDYLNANFPRDKDGKQAGQVHYENLCMKAVNQSIGRAIRHQGDYATILLLDRRYSRSSTVAKLPGWISEHLQKMDKFGPVFAAVSKRSPLKMLTDNGGYHPISLLRALASVELNRSSLGHSLHQKEADCLCTIEHRKPGQLRSIRYTVCMTSDDLMAVTQGRCDAPKRSQQWHEVECLHDNTLTLSDLDRLLLIKKVLTKLKFIKKHAMKTLV